MAFAPDEFTGRSFGKYEALCRLAVGGMAEIFLGYTRTGPFAYKPVVLKRMLSEQREDPTALQLLIDEAKVTAGLHHTNVAQIYDLEVTPDEILLVIQFIQGANLEEVVQAQVEKKELVPVGLVLAVIRDAAQGLHQAHITRDARGQPRPIVHRDVTPRNIMVGFDGVGRVLDFGIARAQGAERRTVAGMVRGTTAYMSPEQAIGQNLDPRSDLFSLGIIFHELLVGQRLFSRENPGKEMAAVYEAPIPPPSALNRRVPKALDPIVLRLLERSLSRRYATATDVVRDLQLAAGSTTWGPERCGELISERFASRHKAINQLVARIDAGGHRLPAGGTQGYDDDSESRTQVERPSAVLGRVPVAKSKEASTATNPGLDSGPPAGPPRPQASPQPRRNSYVEVPTDPARPRGPLPAPREELATAMDLRVQDPDGSAVPTKFFKPDFDDSARATGPDSKITVTRTGAGPGRGVLFAGLAVLAMVVGAAGGALVYRAVGGASPPQSQGVGRLSISTDRPAEVLLGDQRLGTTPLVDLWLPAGRTALRVREENGPWRTLEVDVRRDQVNRVSVKLDTLPEIP